MSIHGSAHRAVHFLAAGASLRMRRKDIRPEAGTVNTIALNHRFRSGDINRLGTRRTAPSRRAHRTVTAAVAANEPYNRYARRSRGPADLHQSATKRLTAHRTHGWELEDNPHTEQLKKR